jgi:hypothetical protein
VTSLGATGATLGGGAGVLDGVGVAKKVVIRVARGWQLGRFGDFRPGLLGVEEAVKDGKSGVLVDGNNAEEIVQAIDFCTKNQEILKVTCQEWAKTHDWEIIGKRFLELI